MKSAVRPSIRSPRHQAGATLLEMAMVIGLIAVIAVTAVSAYNKSSQGRRIAEATGDLGTLVGGIRNTFAAQGSYTGLTNASVIKARFLKESAHSGTTSIHHPWSDAAVTVAPAGTAPHRTFTVTYTSLPEDVCIQLASNTIGNAVGITIGSAVNNVGDITTRCSGDNNTVVWTFD